MELARHTSIGVTQRYMHLSPNAPREAIALLDSRPGGQQVGNDDESTKQKPKKSEGQKRKRTGIEPAGTTVR